MYELLGASGGFGNKDCKRPGCFGAYYRLENLKIAEYIQKYGWAVHAWTNGANKQLLIKIAQEIGKIEDLPCNGGKILKFNEQILLWVISTESAKDYPYCPVLYDERRYKNKENYCQAECVFRKVIRVCCISEAIVLDKPYQSVSDCIQQHMKDWIERYEWLREICGDDYFNCDLSRKNIFLRIDKIRDVAMYNLSYEDFEYDRSGKTVRDMFSKEYNLQFDLMRGRLIPVKLKLKLCGSSPKNLRGRV